MSIIQEPKINKYGNKKPIIVVVGCLHGDEVVGKKVIKEISSFKIIKGTLITIIANPIALSKKKRFIDQDLNRSFPGKKTSKKLEERLAWQIIKIIKNADYVIDIHSTSTDTQDVAIIKKKTENIKKMLKVFKSKRVLLMSKTIGKNALINFCQGVSFEYGSHNSVETFKKSLRDVKRLMVSIGMLRGKRYNLKRESEYYKVYATQNKARDFEINKNIQNFKLIKKGSLIGKVKSKKILAEENFFPVLFGAKSYKNIVGFKAKKIKRIA